MKYLVTLLTAMGVSAASAATVSVASTIPTGGNVHGAGGAQVALKNDAGVTLPAGMRIRVGFFVGYTGALDATLKTPGGVFTLMASNSPNRFIPLGEAPVRVGYGTDSSVTNVTKLVGSGAAAVLRWNTTYSNVTYMGGANDASDDNTLADGGVPRGTKLFVMVYNTGALDADPMAPGFEYGLFSDSSFVVPETGTATLSLNVALVDQASEVYFGALGNSLHTAPIIPEPSTTLVTLLAGLGLISRRRR